MWKVKTDVQAPIKKVVCGDSFEQEMFDDMGNSIMIRLPGKCDVVIVEAENKR